MKTYVVKCRIKGNTKLYTVEAYSFAKASETAHKIIETLGGGQIIGLVDWNSFCLD